MSKKNIDITSSESYRAGRDNQLERDIKALREAGFLPAARYLTIMHKPFSQEAHDILEENRLGLAKE